MNYFWAIMGFAGMLLAWLVNSSAWPLKKWLHTLKANAKKEMKILLLSVFVLLVITFGWLQTGFDDVLHYVAQFFNFTYDQNFFPQGQLNFLLALIGLSMHFLINTIYKRIAKPHEPAESIPNKTQ